MKIHNNKGAAAVEFALVLPILVLLLFGIIEFSLLLYDKAVMTNASREGARYGTLFTDSGPVTCDMIDSVINTYVASNLVTFGTATGVTIAYDPADCQPANPGDPLKVTVTYPYDYLVLPGFLPGLAGGVTIAAETVMKKE